MSSGSGPAYLTGWFNAFFPFTQSKETNFYCKPYDPSGEAYGAVEQPPRGICHDNITDESYGLAPQSLPNGWAKAPVVWNYYGKELPLEFFAGFVGAEQDPGTLELTPSIGWFIRHRRGEA